MLPRQANEKAVAFICDSMATRPWEGAVAEIKTENDKVTLLYLNAGSCAGIHFGDAFDILRPGRPIVNPKIKVVIGRTLDTVLGLCKVDTVIEELSTALPVKREKFQNGDLIRPVLGSTQ
jgi:hypothetical protein